LQPTLQQPLGTLTSPQSLHNSRHPYSPLPAPALAPALALSRVPPRSPRLRVSQNSASPCDPAARPPCPQPSPPAGTFGAPSAPSTPRPAAPAIPMMPGRLSESARPEGTTISEPRLTMLSYSMFIARRLSATGLSLDRKSTRLNSSHAKISYA